MKVSIVIPLYKITPLFFQCMESLARFSPECEVIVIRATGSFADNCNRGIAVSNGDYICLLNDDCVVTEGWLTPLVRFLDEHPKAGAVSPMMLFPEGRVQFGGMVFHSDYSGAHLGWGWKQDDERLLKEPHEFQATTFGCVLLRKAALWNALEYEPNKLIKEQIFLNENYEIGGYEDIDWCFRAKLKEWRIWYQPESKIYHYESATFLTMPQNLRCQAALNNEKFYRERWSPYFEDGTFKVDDKDYEGGISYCYVCKHIVDSHIPDGICKECDCKKFKVGWDK